MCQFRTYIFRLHYCKMWLFGFGYKLTTLREKYFRGFIWVRGFVYKTIDQCSNELTNTSLLLVMSGPAWPYWRKSGVNRVFNTTISGWFVKRLSYVQGSHQCSHLYIDLNLLGLSEIGSCLIIVLKLYIYKYSDVRNLRTIKYFRKYCRPLRNTWNTI